MIGNWSPLAAGHHHPAPWRSRVPPARTPRAGYGQRRRTGSGPCGSGPPRPHTRAVSAAVRSDVRKAEAGPVYIYIWFMIYLHLKASRLDLHRQRSTAVRHHGSRVNHVSRAYRPGPPGRIYGQRCCKQCIGSGLGPCGSGPPRPHTRAASAAVRSDMRRPSLSEARVRVRCHPGPGSARGLPLENVIGPHAPGAGRTWAFADSERLRLRHTRLSYAPRLPMTRMAQRDSDKSDS
jgi:hypothetical protein